MNNYLIIQVIIRKKIACTYKLNNNEDHYSHFLATSSIACKECFFNYKNLELGGALSPPL